MRTVAAAAIFLSVTAALFPAAAQTYGSRPPVDNSGAIAGRLARIEEQLADLQGVVGAVETLAKNNSQAGSGYAAAGGGASAEQIRQLSEQIADLTQRLERLEAHVNGSAAPQAAARQDYGYGSTPASGFEDKQQLPPLGAPQQAPVYPRPQQSASAGQYPPGPVPRYSGTPAVIPVPQPSFPTSPQPSSTGSPSRALFDQAYAALNRREYSVAETYFQQFLDEYPSDPLAGSAQYWLGEAAFVSGEYKSAADRFLKTFTNYPNNERAPEALLKLAISLRRLGNNTDACATFAELAQRYPRAPASVTQRAESEKKRANCG